MYIIRLNFFYRDLQMTLIVLFLFRVVIVFKNTEFLCDFYAEEKFLDDFYLLMEFICNETQNGLVNALMGNRRNTLSPKTNIKRELVICFRFVNIKGQLKFAQKKMFKRKLFGLSVEACVAERLTL